MSKRSPVTLSSNHPSGVENESFPIGPRKRGVCVLSWIFEYSMCCALHGAQHTEEIKVSSWRNFWMGCIAKVLSPSEKIRFNTSIITSMPQKATIRFVLKDPCTRTESEWISIKKIPLIITQLHNKKMCRTRQKYSTRKKRFLMGLYYKSTFSIEKPRFNTSIVASKRQK